MINHHTYMHIYLTFRGEDYYATSSSMIHGTHKPSEAAVNRMVEDLGQQYAKRGRFSRRRAFDMDADIDYINERNRSFNKKIERYYGKYTAEIKQNLERGTAV
jgi:pre-mRNA-splicing factor SYF2